MNDPDPLDPLLQTWQPQPAARSDFAEAVQARIRDEDRAAIVQPWFRSHAALPLAASIAVVIGTIAGTSFRPAADPDAMADAYARSIDPVRMMDMPSLP